MTTLTNRSPIAVLVVFMGLPLTAIGQVLLSSDFQSPASTGFTVRDNTSVPGQSTPDGTVTFGYDYEAAGIGLAPNSASGGGRGLRITVNDTAGASDHYTVFSNIAITEPEYRVSVDMYMGIEGSFGSTEFATIGVGSDGSVFNSIFTPISGDGHFISISGDGGSASDYRHYTPSLESVPSGNVSYLDPANTTNHLGLLYQSIFPSGDYPGSPGNQWVTVTIDVTPSTITYAINGTKIIRVANEDSDGFVGIGYSDAFTSLGPHFVIFDNLSVIAGTPVINAAINNGDFETGLLAPWDVTNNPSLASLSTAYAQSGTYSLALDSTGAVPWSSPQASQADFPAQTADVWGFSGYILTPATIGDASFGILKIVFKDSFGNELVPTGNSKGFIESDPGFPGIETAPRVSSSTTPEEWVFVEAAGTAPAGTTSVSLLALNVNEGVGPSVMYFDNLVATRKPAPPPASPISIQVDGPDALLTYETEKILAYTTEFSTDLSGWTPLATMLGSGAAHTIRFINGRPGPGLKSFFQVVDRPPGLPVGNEVLLNGDFMEGIDQLNGWEAYAVWEQPKGNIVTDGGWALVDAPVVITWDFLTGFSATFAMNTQLATADPFWEGGYQNGMAFQQAFWTPDGPQSGNVVNLYGQVITFSGNLEITEPYALNTIVAVQLQESTSLPGQANQVYTGVVPWLVGGSGSGARFTLARDAAGAISTVKAIDPGSGFTLGEDIFIKGSLVGGVDGIDDVRLVASELTNSRVDVFLQFLDGDFAPVAPSVSLDVTSQGSGVVPFSIQATCPPNGLNVVLVGFRNTGIEGTKGQIRVSELSVTAANP